MKIDPTVEGKMPDSTSQNDDLMPDSQSPDDAKLLEIIAQKFAGPNSSTKKDNRSRTNAKLIRENVIAPDEVVKSRKRSTNPWRAPRRGSYKPLWNAKQLRERLSQYDRTPFLDVLAIWMECTPTPQTIMAFADKYPDRFIKAMTDLGRLSGFAEKRELDVNLSAQVHQMSDSQLEDKLRDAAYRLGIPLPTFMKLTAAREVDARANDMDVTRANSKIIEAEIAETPRVSGRDETNIANTDISLGTRISGHPEANIADIVSPAGKASSAAGIEDSGRPQERAGSSKIIEIESVVSVTEQPAIAGHQSTISTDTAEQPGDNGPNSSAKALQ
jgi:hypothetical protein